MKDQEWDQKIGFPFAVAIFSLSLVDVPFSRELVRFFVQSGGIQKFAWHSRRAFGQRIRVLFARQIPAWRKKKKKNSFLRVPHCYHFPRQAARFSIRSRSGSSRASRQLFTETPSARTTVFSHFTLHNTLPSRFSALLSPKQLLLFSSIRSYSRRFPRPTTNSLATASNHLEHETRPRSSVTQKPLFSTVSVCFGRSCRCTSRYLVSFVVKVAN